MLRLSPRSKLILFSALAIVVLGAAIPVALNSMVRGRLNLADIKRRLAENVKSQTGLHLEAQGVRYRFLQGIVLTGLKVEVPGRANPEHILETENLALELSLIELFRGRNPFPRLVVSGGRINPWAITGTEWRALFATVSKAVPPEFSPSMVVFRNMRLVIPQRVIPAGPHLRVAADLRVHLEVHPLEKSYRLTVRDKDGGDGGPQLTARGDWKLKRERRLDFRFRQLPIGLLVRLARAWSIWPPELQRAVGAMRIKGGTIRGRGSMDKNNLGIGINVAGKYRGLQLSLGSAGALQVGLRKGGGSFRYTTAYLELGRGPDHAELKVNESDLELDLLYRRLKGKQKLEHFVSMTARASFSAKADDGHVFARAPGIRTSGELALKTRYDYARGWVMPMIDLRLSNFKVHLDSPVFRLVRNGGRDPRLKMESTPTLHWKQFSLKQVAGKEALAIAAHGNLGKASFRAAGTSASYVLLSTSATSPSLTLKQKIKLKVEVDGLPYRRLVIPAARLHGSLVRAALQKSRERSPEHLLKRKQFLGPLYKRAIFDGVDFDVDVHFRRMRQTGGSLPAELKLNLHKRSANVTLTLAPARTEKAFLEFSYRGTYFRAPPWHRVELTVDVKENHLPLPEFFADSRPPGRVYVGFWAEGHGWLAQDVVTQTSSNLTLNLERVYMGAHPAAIILKHKLALPKPAFLLKTFQFKRRSLKYTSHYSGIQFASPHLDGTAHGYYTIARGGRLRINYQRVAGADGKRPPPGYIDLLISEDRKWSPAGI